MTKRELRKEFNQTWLQGKPKEFVSVAAKMLIARYVCQMIALTMIFIFIAILSASDDGVSTGGVICLIVSLVFITVGDGLDSARKAEWKKYLEENKHRITK